MSARSKILLINLDQSTERLARCDSLLSEAGLEYERVSGVYGADLNPEQIAQHYDPQLGRRSYYKKLNVGEIGCYLSHRKAWQKILDEQLEFAAILEDDFFLTGDLARVLELVEEIGLEWHYLKLAKHSRKRRVIHSLALGEYRLVTYNKIPSRTCAQVVSYTGAQRLLATSQPFGRPVDLDLEHWWEKDISVFGIEPYPLLQKEGGESVIDDLAKRDQAEKRVLKGTVDRLAFSLNNWNANRRRLRLLNRFSVE